MKLALVSLSNEGARVAARLAEGMGPCDVFLHSAVTKMPQARRFDRVVELTSQIFTAYEGIVYIAPTGVVVRAVGPLASHKTVDPAVVVVDVGGRWAVSLLSGHEGGANDLALAVANVLGAEPIVTTTTEAVKTLIVGVGCRRETPAETIVDAVHQALARLGETEKTPSGEQPVAPVTQVRLLASADIKSDEAGLLEAARRLGVPLRLIPSEEIRTTVYHFEPSKLAQEKVDLPAVAEPAALLAGRRTRLILPRQIINSVTVAIARENCTSLESDPAGPRTGPIEPSTPSPTAG